MGGRVDKLLSLYVKVMYSIYEKRSTKIKSLLFFCFFFPNPEAPSDGDERRRIDHKPVVKKQRSTRDRTAEIKVPYF